MEREEEEWTEGGEGGGATPKCADREQRRRSRAWVRRRGEEGGGGRMAPRCAEWEQREERPRQ
eukprot:3873925-Rhodomonas_salina.1